MEVFMKDDIETPLKFISIWIKIARFPICVFPFEFRPREILEELITETTLFIHQVLGQHAQGLLDLCGFLLLMCS